MRLKGALHQVLARLHQHLNGHVGGNAPALDQFAAEIEVGLRGGRKADLDLLESARHQQLEHAQLAVGSMGSISAWLPSRKSTLHHTGAFSIDREGHRRSSRRKFEMGWYLVLGTLSIFFFSYPLIAIP